MKDDIIVFKVRVVVRAVCLEADAEAADGVSVAGAERS